MIQKSDDTHQPVLAIAVRGPHAHSVLRELTRSSGHLLLRQTDPSSLNPVDCRGQEPPLLSSPCLDSQVHRELCLWFSGRLGEESAQNHNQPLNRFDVSVPKCNNICQCDSFYFYFFNIFFLTKNEIDLKK